MGNNFDVCNLIEKAVMKTRNLESINVVNFIKDVQFPRISTKSYGIHISSKIVFIYKTEYS